MFCALCEALPDTDCMSWKQIYPPERYLLVTNLSASMKLYKDYKRLWLPIYHITGERTLARVERAKSDRR